MDYKQECSRTWSANNPFENQVEHAILGIKSECGEYLSAIKKNVGYKRELDIINIEEELGDLYYFTYTLIRIFKLDVDTNDFQKILYPNTITLQKITDIIYSCSSYLFNNFNTHDQNLRGIKENLTVILKNINTLCWYHNLNPADVKVSNINKLKVRFPEKFSTEDALIRNKEKERNAIAQRKN